MAKEGMGTTEGFSASVTKAQPAPAESVIRTVTILLASGERIVMTAPAGARIEVDGKTIEV